MDQYIDNWLHTDEEVTVEGQGGRSPVVIKACVSSVYVVSARASLKVDVCVHVLMHVGVAKDTLHCTRGIVCVQT